MGRKINSNENLIDDRSVRDKWVEHYEILEKVKRLLLIPDVDGMTLKQVADYYEADPHAIEMICNRNSDELESDGVIIKPMKDFLNSQDVSFEKGRNKMILTYKNGISFTVTNRGLKIFPRRAILRIGMLLRDSVIAKEVRTQLLNIEEKVIDEVKTRDINEEQTLMLNIGMAYASGNVDAIMKATTEYNAFQNRHIKRLENDNKALAKGILEWEDRKKLNAGMRRLAGLAGKDFAVMWNELYRNLQYKLGICLKQRGDKPYINHIEKHEWNSVMKIFCAMCEAYGQSPTEIFQTTPMDNLVLHN